MFRGSSSATISSGAPFECNLFTLPEYIMAYNSFVFRTFFKMINTFHPSAGTWRHFANKWVSRENARFEKLREKHAFAHPPAFKYSFRVFSVYNANRFLVVSQLSPVLNIRPNLGTIVIPDYLAEYSAWLYICFNYGN